MKDWLGILNHQNGKEKANDNQNVADSKKLLLRKEELDVSKTRVEAGKVELTKEVIEERKTVDVPVMREEVVIERKAVSEPSDIPVGDNESITIPVAEEQVQVGKHTVVTGEISAHKNIVEETKKVEDILKREEARVHTSGDPHLVDERSDYLE
jgi:uncharacterized protein (TIGR02271 family)